MGRSGKVPRWADEASVHAQVEVTTFQISSRFGVRALNGRIKRKEGKYVGSSWEPARQKWHARIRDGKRKIFLGEFENEKDAALAFDKVPHFKDHS